MFDIEHKIGNKMNNLVKVRNDHSIEERERMPAGTFRNTVLRHLDSATVDRLQLKRTELPLLHDLALPGEPINYITFLEEGVASMTTAFINGDQVETGMFGFESAVGLSALMGSRHSLNRVFMQFAGYGYSAPLRTVRTEFAHNEPFRYLLLRCVQAQLTWSTQNAACNSSHTYEQRLARWLLLSSDHAQRDQLELDQEFVSEMLGSTRSTVSIAAAHFKRKGLIDYGRGTIRLIKKKELEAEACECYRVVRDHLESYRSFDRS